LPKLNNKVLIHKDFTSVLTLRSENQTEILSQLREIADGAYDKIFGNGKRVSWRGKVGFIGGVTGAYDKHHSTISALGDRFILYRTNTDDQELMGYRAVVDVGKETLMRTEIKNAVHKFLNQFNGLTDLQFSKSEEMIEKIVAMVCFIAMGRCAVERNHYTKAIEYLPAAEGSPRLSKALMMLAMGVALARGVTEIDESVYTVIKKVALSIIPAHRRVLLQYLWNEEAFEYLHFWKKTGEIADSVKLPRATVKDKLEDMEIVGILAKTLMGDTDVEDEKRVPYAWSFIEKAYNYAKKCQLFEQSANELPF
jgi:hypothetical protein